MIMETATKNLSLVKMSDKVFNGLAKFIHTNFGIKMPPEKKTLLESRLQKRLRALGLKSFTDYYNYLQSEVGMREEVVHLIDQVSTNKTDFFREPSHFDYLVKKALPDLINNYKSGIRRKLFVWSAGCSTGEEPYTLAMVLSNFAENNPNFRFTILGTDISTQALEKARLGIYRKEKVEPVPMAFKRKYLLKSKDGGKGLVRIVPELRALVTFRRLNFMDHDFGLHEPVDIIFCRNVIIYFNKDTQQKLLNKFYRYLIPGGYIFLGHSETLNGLNVPYIPLVPTVYKRKG